MRLVKILTIMFLLGSSRAWAVQDFDFQVEPSPGDNFLEAGFRFTNPEPGKVPERILVYIPGTDGDARSVVDDPAFLQACRKCHAALVGCYFRGEGLSYDTPSGGSGNALDMALASFAAQTEQPQLAQLPLLLMGFSQGSQFTFNYVCWHPNRVEAFAAIKAGGFALKPNEESFRVPGLLVAGQYDEPGRIRTTAQAFMGSAGKNAKWAFLFEKGAGHDMTRIGSFALQFLDAVCENAGEVVYRHADTGEAASSSSSDADVCWFPDEATATTWGTLHQRTPLAELAHMPDPVAVGSVIQVTITPASFSCANGQRQDGTIKLSTSQEGVSVQSISVSGPGVALTGPAGGKLPLQTTLSFTPVDFDWGSVSADITISGEQSGHELAPETITLHSLVQGPVTPAPRLLYLGIAHPQETVRKTIQLKVSGSGAHIAKITSPSDVIATPQEIPGTDDLVLQVTWAPSKRLGSMSGEIRIDLDRPEKGTLRIPVVGVVERL
jgi:pimeloyl-ACP methyl ester carboxylesterase